MKVYCLFLLSNVEASLPHDCFNQMLLFRMSLTQQPNENVRLPCHLVVFGNYEPAKLWIESLLASFHVKGVNDLVTLFQFFPLDGHSRKGVELRDVRVDKGKFPVARVSSPHEEQLCIGLLPLSIAA